ncbi:uncharacterized protein LOC114285285 [Camellia sinensis]|uniref:uncharacterized protein LOC114285285 n=1 Tax=Camellia sinensis TaxID=4442 RepID=UPI001036D416|nr:uncharacterized protein LOC114285285 [Camellia sinensis]
MGAQEKSPTAKHSMKRAEELGLFVIDEEDNETLLVHRISSDDIYRKQEDTIISWRDPELSTELALSFQESTGCSYIWDHICSVQRNMHFNTLNNETHHSVNSEVRELPAVELSTLPIILKEKDTVKVSKRKGNKSGGTVKVSTRKGDKSGGTGKASTRKGDKSGGTVKLSDREDNKTGVKIQISLEEILQTSKMKLGDAAQSLGASKSTLKRACREYGIEKWHRRFINKAVKKSAPPSMPKLMRDSITDLQEQEQRKIKATQTTSREVRSKKRQEPSTTSMLQEDFNPTFSEREIPLSQMFGPTVHNSPDQTYQRKMRRDLISTDIEDEESPNSTPKEASQIPSNTRPHHPSKPSDPILNQSTLNNSVDVTLEDPGTTEPFSINHRDAILDAFPMEVLYPRTTEPINFPSVTSLDSSANGNPTSIDEIPTRSHCDISSPRDQFNEPSQSKFQTNHGTETQVEGTPTNCPEPTNENNTEVRAEKMDNASSSDKQVGEHTPTPMDDSPHGINQTTGVKNMEENPSVNENIEDINPYATSEPPGISSSLQALEVPSTLISLETPHVSMEKTTIGETSTPITNPINPASTVVQASSSSNTGSLSIWEEIAAFQKSVEHISRLPKRLHHFKPEDQQVISSFLNLINTSFEEIISKQLMETLNCLTAIQRLSPTPFSQNQLSHLAQIISEWPVIVETAQNCRNTIQAKKDFLMAVQTTSDSLTTTCQASSNLSDQDRSLALEEARLEAELALVRQKRHELQQEMDILGHEAKIILSKTENNLSSIQAAKEEFDQAQATFAATQSKWSIFAHIFRRD